MTGLQVYFTSLKNIKRNACFPIQNATFRGCPHGICFVGKNCRQSPRFLRQFLPFLFVWKKLPCGVLLLPLFLQFAGTVSALLPNRPAVYGKKRKIAVFYGVISHVL